MDVSDPIEPMNPDGTEIIEDVDVVSGSISMPVTQLSEMLNMIQALQNDLRRSENHKILCC